MNRMTILMLIAVFLVGCGSSSEYLTKEKFVQSEMEKGFKWEVGFGRSWPAKPEQERIAEDSVSFILGDGAEHSFNDYEGYTLKVVRLRGKDGKEIVALFRSIEKRNQ